MIFGPPQTQGQVYAHASYPSVSVGLVYLFSENVCVHVYVCVFDWMFSCVCSLIVQIAGGDFVHIFRVINPEIFPANQKQTMSHWRHLSVQLRRACVHPPLTDSLSSSRLNTLSLIIYSARPSLVCYLPRLLVRQTDIHTDRQTDRQTYRQTDRRTDGRTDGRRMDGWMDG